MDAERAFQESLFADEEEEQENEQAAVSLSLLWRNSARQMQLHE